MRVIVTAAIAALLLAAPAGAQEYPTRALRIIMPFGAGGGGDLLARVLAQRLQEGLGQTVIVDNRPGAGGNIGAEVAARSAPDGYTLLFTTAALVINATLYPKLAFDAGKDLVAIVQIASTPAALTVHPLVPVRSVRDLVALAKKTRGGLNFGSNGSGTVSHLAGVMFQQTTGAPLTHIPYKGSAPALNALVGGETDFAFPGVNSAQSFLRAGKVRALAVTTKRKSAVLPELPTIDSIYPGFEIDNWFMLLASAATPMAIINRLNAEALKGMLHPDMKAFMAREGAEPAGGTSAETAAFFTREVEKFSRIVKAAGVKAE